MYFDTEVWKIWSQSIVVKDKPGNTSEKLVEF